MAEAVSAHDPHERHAVAVLDTRMAYVDTGTGPPVVFLHGNPTSSYLWRNVIPPVAAAGFRCLAPDLVGMGESGPAPAGSYEFLDHARYLDAWFDAVLGDAPAILVGHDWGGALGMYRARRLPDRVRGFAYMETIVTPLSWGDWGEAARGIFQAMRSEKGEDLVLQRNVFVEKILPASVLRGLGEAEMAVYRKPFAEAGERRRPTLTWPRQIPVDGSPAAMVELIAANEAFMRDSPMPKLFVNAEPGSILVGRQREICRAWPNQREVTVAGSHFIQEDQPAAIGAAVAAFAGAATEDDR